MPPRPRNGPPRRLRQRVAASEALGAVARRFGSRELGLGLAWAFAAGGRVSQHVRPLHLESRRLLLRTSDPHWAREIRRNEAVLLERLATFLGEGRVLALVVEVDAQGA